MRTKKKKIAVVYSQENHSQYLEWSLEPQKKECPTGIVHTWETKDGQYQALRLESTSLDRPAFGAQYKRGKFWDIFEHSHSQGPGYPRYYKSLEEALVSVEVFHLKRTGKESVRTNIEEVVNQARKQGLDGTRRKSEKITEVSNSPPKSKPGRKSEGKIGCLDAAILVLQEEGRPLRADEMIPLMSERGYWTSPGGKTPEATLSSSIGVEIREKKKESRFVKVGRGLFSLA